jgi:hypothetical protein
MFFKTKGLHGETSCQVFTDGDFVWVHPMRSKSQASEALEAFVKELPSQLAFNNSKEQMCPGTDFMKSVDYNRIDWSLVELYTPWQNKAKDAI